MLADLSEGRFCVRKARPEDHPLLQSVLDGSEGAPNVRVYGWSAAELLQKNHIYLGFLKERPIGCVMITRAEPMVVHGLNVVLGDRRKGYAGNLLASAVIDIDAAAPRELWTAVDPRQQSGVDRCVALGFKTLTVDFTVIETALSEMNIYVRPAGGQNPVPDELTTTDARD